VSYEREVVSRSKKVYLESLKDDIQARRNKDFFWPTGTQVYVGRQGSGKTISAIYHLRKLDTRYPKSITVTNVNLFYKKPISFRDEKHLAQIVEQLKTVENRSEYYIKFSSMDELELVLRMVNNGFFGVIYLIDEIHTYFNALDSKNIPIFVFTEISQQRKQRKLIIGTSQLFMRMAKPFREQCDNLIMCSTKMGFWTFQTAYDGMTLEQDYDGTLSGDVRKRGWFFHTRKLRESFDTYQKVQSATMDMGLLEVLGKTELRSRGKPLKMK